VPATFFSDINAFIPRELCFALEHRLQRLTGDRPWWTRRPSILSL